MALENLEFKDQIGLICEGSKIVKRRRREEEEEEEKRKKESQAKKVWMLGFWYGTLNFV